MKDFNDLFVIAEQFIKEPYVSIVGNKHVSAYRDIPIAKLKKEYEKEVIDTVLHERLLDACSKMSLQEQFDSCRLSDQFECGYLPQERLDDDFPILSTEHNKCAWGHGQVSVDIDYVLATENNLLVGLCIQGKILWVGGEISYKTEAWSSGDNNGAGYKGEGYYTATKYLALAYNPDFARLDTIFKSEDNKKLKSVVIPEGIKVIAARAFSCCEDLEEVIFHESLEEIGEYAFENCQKLKKIVIPAGAKRIFRGAFFNCSALEYVDLGGVCRIGDWAFRYCSLLETVVFSNNKTLIEDQVFDSCSRLKKLVNSENIYRCYRESFSYCKFLEEIRLDGMESIGDDAFRGCIFLKKIHFSDSLKWIGNNAFANCCSLKGINIPDSVWHIGRNAFDLSSLKRVTISKQKLQFFKESFFSEINFDFN